MLTLTNPNSAENIAKRKEEIAVGIAKLTQSEINIIKQEFAPRNFYNSTETFLYLPTFMIVNNADNKKLVNKLLKLNLADFDKMSGCSINGSAKKEIEKLFQPEA